MYQNCYWNIKMRYSKCRYRKKTLMLKEQKNFTPIKHRCETLYYVNNNNVHT